jgi:exosome complex component RRP42
MSAPISLSKSEKSYIQTALRDPSPIRADGRSLLDYRSIALETGVASLANGSARVNVGKTAGEESGSGTEVIAAVKLEVENVLEVEGVDGGRIACTVSWFVSDSPSFSFLLSFGLTNDCKASSPAAYPHLTSVALDDLSYDMTIILNQCLSHPSLHPKNLGIIPRRKSWLLNLDLIVLSDSGNVYDALFLAARSALWDTKVPKTRSVQYQPKSNVAGDQDVEMSADGSGSIFNTREVTKAADFELADYWDEGEPLEINQQWPVCVTLNLVSPAISFV